MNVTSISLTILALYAAGISAGALTAMWPPFLQVFAALTGQDLAQARRFVASVSLSFGCAAIFLFSFVLEFSS